MIKLNFQGLTPQKLGQTDRQTDPNLPLPWNYWKTSRNKKLYSCLALHRFINYATKIHQRVYQKQQVSNLHHNARISYCARRFIVVFVESAETLFV